MEEDKKSDINEKDVKELDYQQLDEVTGGQIMSLSVSKLADYGKMQADIAFKNGKLY